MTHFKKITVTLVGLFIGLVIPAPAQALSDFGNIDTLLADNMLDEAAQRYSSALLSFQPEQASRLGFTSSYDKLTSRSAQDSAQLLAALRSVRESVEQLDEKQLSPAKQADRQLLLNALDNSIWQEEQNRFRQDPLYYTEALDAVYDVLLHPAASKQRQQHNLSARLNALTAVAAQAEQNLSDVSPFLAKLAMEKTYYAYLSAEDWQGALQPADATDLASTEQANRTAYNAKQAMRKMFDLFKQLSQQESSRDFRLGQSDYFNLLQTRYQWKAQKPAPFLASLEKNVQETQKALTEALEPFLEQAETQEITVVDGNNDTQTQTVQPVPPAAKKKKSKKLAPRNAQDFYAAAKPFMTAEPEDDPLQTFTQQVRQAYQFLTNSGALTEQPLAFNFAPLSQYYAYMQAYRFVPPDGPEGHPQFLLRIPSGNQQAKQELFNQDFNISTRKLTISGEVIPGRYYRAANTTGQSRLRQLYPAESMQNGWTVYAKRLARQKGYLSLDEDLLFLAWDEYMRALAAWTDAKLHTRQYSYADALAFLTQTHGLTDEHAEDMLKQIAAHPGKAVSYQIGLSALEDAHQKFSKKYGKKFSEADFNAKLLQAGNVLPNQLEKELSRLYKREQELKKLGR